MRSPEFAEKIEGPVRDWDVAIFGALAVADVDEATRTINVRDLEMDAFLKPESAGVNGDQAAAIDRKPDQTKDAADLVG